MTTKKDTQSQQTTPPTSPFGADAMSRATEAWSEMSRQGIERTQAFWSELASYEAIAVERAREQVAQFAKLADDSLAYAGKLAEEWRTLAVDTARRNLDRMDRKAA
jgi:hypothetical protein